MATASEYNARIIEEFRATGGHSIGERAGTPMILIHHIGAKPGIERVTPLGCFPLGGGRYAVVASSGGAPAHPDWYHNLKARPVTTVEVGSETFTAVAGKHSAYAVLAPVPPGDRRPLKEPS
jgi:deazaflavin-dependent oxidoreductase (nitroreductase family)